MSERVFGFGVVGCGVISDTHLDAIRSLPNARIVAVCDTREEAARAKAEQYGCAWYTDLAEMLRRDDLQVCNVVVPSGLHARLGIQCAEAGKHVICTKPIDITLENIDALIAAAEANGVLVGATHQCRGTSVYKRLKQAIVDGRLGKLLYGNAVVPWYRSDEYYSDGWHGTRKLDGGGALMNQAIHSVDLLAWLMGPVVEVRAQTALLAHQRIAVEDVAVAAVRFANGALGVIEATTAAFPGYLKRIEIHGSEGSAVMEEEDLVKWDFAKKQRRDALIHQQMAQRRSGGGGAADPAAIGHHGHLRQFKDVLQAIRKGAAPLVDGAEGRRSVEIILAIYRSAETGKAVSLPLPADPPLRARKTLVSKSAPSGPG